MVDSKAFALGIFDALARRKRQRITAINKEQLYDFWQMLSDQSFDARLQIFFDMYAFHKLSSVCFPIFKLSSEMPVLNFDSVC